jgi:hypothetical protein
MAAADLFDLSGKVAVITGGAGGIGVVYAQALVEAGRPSSLPTSTPARPTELPASSSQTASPQPRQVWTCGLLIQRRRWHWLPSTRLGASTSSSTTRRS